MAYIWIDSITSKKDKVLASKKNVRFTTLYLYETE